MGQEISKEEECQIDSGLYESGKKGGVLQIFQGCFNHHKPLKFILGGDYMLETSVEILNSDGDLHFRFIKDEKNETKRILQDRNGVLIATMQFGVDCIDKERVDVYKQDEKVFGIHLSPHPKGVDVQASFMQVGTRQRLSFLRKVEEGLCVILLDDVGVASFRGLKRQNAYFGQVEVGRGVDAAVVVLCVLASQWFFVLDIKAGSVPSVGFTGIKPLKL
jgi:hypothetical protein